MDTEDVTLFGELNSGALQRQGPDYFMSPDYFSTAPNETAVKDGGQVFVSDSSPGLMPAISADQSGPNYVRDFQDTGTSFPWIAILVLLAIFVYIGKGKI